MTQSGRRHEEDDGEDEEDDDATRTGKGRACHDGSADDHGNDDEIDAVVMSEWEEG